MSRWAKKPAAPAPALVPGAAHVTAVIPREARARLGDVLVAEQRLLPEQLAEALNLQLESGRQLGTILVEQGLLNSRSLTEALASQLGVPTVDLRTVRPTPEALAFVPEAMARRLQIVPLRLTDNALDVAAADSSKSELTDALARLDVDKVNIFLAPVEDVATSLNTYYRVLSESDENVKQFWETAAAEQAVEAVVGAPTMPRSSSSSTRS